MSYFNADHTNEYFYFYENKCTLSSTHSNILITQKTLDIIASYTEPLTTLFINYNNSINFHYISNNIKLLYVLQSGPYYKSSFFINSLNYLSTCFKEIHLDMYVKNCDKLPPCVNIIHFHVKMENSYIHLPIFLKCIDIKRCKSTQLLVSLPESVIYIFISSTVIDFKIEFKKPNKLQLIKICDIYYGLDGSWN